MAQRSSFWSRHASPNSETPHRGNTNSSSPSSPTHATNTGGSGHDRRQSQGHATRDHLSEAPHEGSHASSIKAAYLQPRLPPNSTPPVANTSANAVPAPSSFSSSYSSSPSPSPSINPYAGSLRSMLQGTHPNQVQTQTPATTKAMCLTGTMPANIRRSGGPDVSEPPESTSGSTPQPLSRHYTESSAQGVSHTTDYSRLQSQPQPQAPSQHRFSQVPKSAQPSGSGSGSGNRDARCEQIIQNFYSKVAQVVAHLRAYSPAHANSSYRYEST
ncbi:hypothetical protein FBU31_005392, partial [Coemansia sp. 'formosensis']